MNIHSIIKQNLRHYRRANTGVFIGIILTGMILTGTLLVGDSARQTLMNIALARLGGTDLLIYSRDRFFDPVLADKIEKTLANPTTAILFLNGVAMNSGDSGQQVNSVNIIGITPGFNEFSQAHQINLAENEVAINEKTAQMLTVQQGDEISIRINKPGILPRDAPLSSRMETPYVRGTFKVRSILSDNGIGRFSPKANQSTPNNIFIRLADLQLKTDLRNKSNLMLVKQREESRISVADAEKAINTVWSPEDFGLKVRRYAPTNILQLETDRVFFDPVFMNLTAVDAIGSLTYLVNSVSRKTSDNTFSTPYSFVTAIDASSEKSISPVSPDMKDSEILITRWLANQLNAGKGDTLTLACYAVSETSQLTEQIRSFAVRDIIEMDALQSEKFLAPDFPGLSDVESCASWDIGIPMDAELLKDKPNEEYWNMYKGTPKAFITLKAGQELWGSRFGNLTALRFPGNSYNTTDINRLLHMHITPAQLGFVFQPARDQAQKSVNTAMDLGQLFTGMSFFLMAAALTLTALLFSFGVDQRSEEIGVLLSLGYTPARIRTLFLLEASFVALVSSIIGAAAGILYTRFLLWGLRELWSDAIANSSIEFHSSILSPLTGGLLSFLMAMAVITISIHTKTRASAHKIITRSPNILISKASNLLYNRRRLIFLSSALTLCALSLIIYAVVFKNNSTNIFYVSGTLLLLAGIGYASSLLSLINSAAVLMTANNLGFKNAAWRPGRSLAVTGILACGIFMVFSIFAMKQDVTRNADKRSSGTGGFDLFGETSIPILSDIGMDAGKSYYKLNADPLMSGVSTTCIKVWDADDASCFNLNRDLTPTILAVDCAYMSRLRAFMPEGDKTELWQQLNVALPDGAVPALVGDANTALWGLQKKTGPINGDTIDIIDESGAVRKIKLTGTLPMPLSVFQGSILVSQQSFSSLFPSRSGYQMFLADTPDKQTAEAAAIFRSKLNRLGIEIEPSTERLKAFYSVESAYLSMFLVLGGLGLLLGTAGLGVILMKNTMERRSELALMRCLGFSLTQINKILATEYTCLIVAGITCGSIAALTAIWPNLHSPAVTVPWRIILLLGLGILASAIIFTFAAIHLVTKGPLLSSLRQE